MVHLPPPCQKLFRISLNIGRSLGPQELLRASASEVHFKTAVSGVSGDAKGKYYLFGGGGRDDLGTFDAVIIAVPISLAGIALDVRAEVTVTPHPMWPPVFAAYVTSF